MNFPRPAHHGAPILAMGMCALLFACAASPKMPARGPAIPMDIHSHARPERVSVTHLSLDLTVDFAKRRIAGSAELDLHRFDREAPLVLDQQALEISAVIGPDGNPRKFEVAPES